jgi:hypothetical protein
MARLGFLCRRSISRTGYRVIAIVMPSIGELGCRIDVLVFLLLSFRAGPFGLLGVTAFATIQVFSESSLPFRGFLSVQFSGNAVDAEVLVGNSFTMVVAFDVLPRIATRAVYSIAVIIGVNTYTLDGILLLVRVIRV